MEGYLPIIELILLAVLTGFFFGIEPAMSSVNRLSVELKKKQGKTTGHILSHILSNPGRMIGASLLASSLLFVITVLTSIKFSSFLWQVFPDEWKNSPLKMVPEWITAFLVLYFSIHLIVSLVKAKSNTALGIASRLLDLVFRYIAPVALMLTRLGEWILQYLFDIRLTNKKDIFFSTDAEQLISQSRGDGEDIHPMKDHLFENALSLPGVKVRECLIPRKEIIGVDIKTGLSDITQKFIDTQLSRLIVYNENIDHIEGYIHQQDLFKKPTDISSVLHPIPAVPESMSITDLISRFTKERKSIAWVVDEFGGTSGIVTMEDLLEEIFGEIKDEYDTEEFVEKETEPGVYIFSGRLELDYIRDKYGLVFDEAATAETLSGYIVEFHETIPKVNTTIIIHRLEFEIISGSDTRIETVRVKVLGSA